jgi:hypothetical protein
MARATEKIGAGEASDPSIGHRITAPDRSHERLISRRRLADMSRVMKATLSMAVAIAAVVAIVWLASTLADVLGGIIVLAAMPSFTPAIMDLAAEPAEEPQRLGRPRFSHVPIRVRLTIVFVAIMATVLAAAGVFVYAQFHSTLDAQISDALRLEDAVSARCGC